MEPMSETFDGIRKVVDSVEKIAKLYANTSKILFPVMVALGLMFVGSFTIRAAIPFPQPDATLVGFLLLLGVVGWLLATYFTCLSFMPVAAIYFTEFTSLAATRREVRESGVAGDGEINGGAPATQDDPRHEGPTSDAKSIRGPKLEKLVGYIEPCIHYVGQYIGIYLPFILSSVAWSLAAAYEPANRQQFLYDPYFILACVFILTSLVIIMMQYAMERHHGKPISAVADNAGSRISKSGAAFLTVASSAIACFWALNMFLVVVALAIRDNLIPRDASPLWLIVIVLAMIVWHATIRAIVVMKLHLAASALALVLLVSILISFSAQIGGLCLRPFRFGGGTPVSMVLANLYDPSTKATAPAEVYGCLVLAIGPQVTIQLLHGKPKTIQCHLSPKTPVEVDGTKTHIDPVTINSSNVLTRVDFSPR